MVGIERPFCKYTTYLLLGCDSPLLDIRLSQSSTKQIVSQIGDFHLLMICGPDELFMGLIIGCQIGKT